jgi:hypothetical protein
MWTKTRLAAYISAALIGLGVILSMIGAADYDAAAGTLDLHPINVYALAGIIAGPLASAMAAVMVWWQGSVK